MPPRANGTYRTSCEASCVQPDLVQRTGFLAECRPPCDVAVPSDVVLDDGVTEDEAIAIALANNSAFQATLAQLGMSRGDLIQAGLLTNPNLITLLPVGVKQWEWTLFLPIESFLLRPLRVDLARDDYHRVAQSLVQNGLNLVRDVRVAYADLALAAEQAALAEEGVRLRREVANITDRRFANGDISALEVKSAKIDLFNAEANAVLLRQNIVIAEARLEALLSTGPLRTALLPTPLETLDIGQIDTQRLIEEALCSRPDIRVAEWAVQAAAKRADLARWLFLRIDAGLDANSKGQKGFELGPGLRFDIPVFNKNQGGVTRARAELRQAKYNRDLVRDQIIQEIRTAAAQLEQSQASLAIIEQSVIPTLNESLEIARNGYEDGGVEYLLVLQTTTQFLDARARAFDQIAAIRRARAELERSVGRQLMPAHDWPAVAEEAVKLLGEDETDEKRLAAN